MYLLVRIYLCNCLEKNCSICIIRSYVSDIYLGIRRIAVFSMWQLSGSVLCVMIYAGGRLMVFLVVHWRHLKQVSNNEVYQSWDTKRRIEPLHNGFNKLKHLWNRGKECFPTWSYPCGSVWLKQSQLPAASCTVETQPLSHLPVVTPLRTAPTAML